MEFQDPSTQGSQIIGGIKNVMDRWKEGKKSQKQYALQFF